MQTNCPQCGTQFRVTETQINAADGYVRCGVCEEVFNVYGVAGNASQEHDPQPALYNADQEEMYSPEIPGNAAIETSDDSPLDSFDFFERGNDELMEHVVPRELRELYTVNSHSTASTILWSLGFLLLSATLVLQYSWFNRDKLIQVPEIQAEIEKLCQTFDCKSLAMRNPSKIELLNRNIYSHPIEKDALMVKLTMKNIAGFSQPYPVMTINFSDIRGSVVASRHFLPGEYLAEARQNTKQQHLLAPNTDTSVTLEIQDPGIQAMTYEFKFL